MKSQLTADKKAFDRQGRNLDYLVYYKINCCLKGRPSLLTMFFLFAIGLKLSHHSLQLLNNLCLSKLQVALFYIKYGLITNLCSPQQLLYGKLENTIIVTARLP